MPRARKDLVSIAVTPYYHVYSRCVRRAFLCGIDQSTGKSYEHRRGWLEDRVRVLSSIFSIDICAFAIMSNHYHLVVKLNPSESERWSEDEVLERWTTLFRGPLLVQRYRAGAALGATELDTVRAIAAVYRERLGDLSWFMKCLNEPIARQANAEDDCTGHFWEARFGSQPICSEQALFAAMAYVDLNPVRAGLAQTPEASEYTSIHARLRGSDKGQSGTGPAERMLERGELFHMPIPIKPLLGFSHSVAATGGIRTTGNTLPLAEQDYLQLVDATGRIIAGGKRGRIAPSLDSILARLGLSLAQWTQSCTSFAKHYRRGHLRLEQTA